MLEAIQREDRQDRPRQPTDGEAVQRVLEGDGLAFEIVMRRYNQRLFRLARAIVKDAAEAEDIVQETYVKAFVKLADFRGPGGFAAWLAKIATNEALGRLRQRRRFPAADFRRDDGTGDGHGNDNMIDSLVSPRPDPEQSATDGETRRILESAIDALPGDFRAVFVLRAVEQMTTAETAACLGIGEATVKTRLHRARGALQKTLRRRMSAALGEVYPFAGVRCGRIVASVFARLGLDPGTIDPKG